MRTPWLSNVYSTSPDVVTIKKNIDEVDYHILINPNIGSWVVLSQKEHERYLSDEFTETEYETLYLRGLAIDNEGEMATIAFPRPAEYPSVVVVNITTFCNLRCLYCFADCEEFQGEDMCEKVMERVITEMLSMPSENITFELQGGEPLCYLDGLEKFIQISEKINETHKKTIKYRAVTNGTLIDDRFINLSKKYDIKFGISIDGPKDLTDQVRVYADGRGAFDDIMAGVARCRAAGLAIDGSVCTLGSILFI